jgi:hypothetical protein
MSTYIVSFLYLREIRGLKGTLEGLEKFKEGYLEDLGRVP